MKTRNLLFMLVVVIMLASCNKEEATTSSNNTPSSNNAPGLTILKSTTFTAPDNQNAFTIKKAGIYDKYLYLELEYLGDRKDNQLSLVSQFLVVWDGAKKVEGDKSIVELQVYRDATDNGTQVQKDSLVADLTGIGITDKELKDATLWFRVVNSTNNSNSFTFRVVQNQATGTPVVAYSSEVEVMEGYCDKAGIWGNLFLKRIEADDAMNVLPGQKQYYTVISIDQSVNYNAVKNDLLKITYEYGFFGADSSSVKNCPDLYHLGAIPVRLTGVEKIN